MDENAVCSYVGQTQSTIEAVPQMDEANTKAAVLRDEEIPVTFSTKILFIQANL